MLTTDGINLSAKSANDPGISCEKDFICELIMKIRIRKYVRNLVIFNF
tara:strand:- start:1390 stop:1533 length:144 start_codon:yes stop_codon:yes gene_type:complete